MAWRDRVIVTGGAGVVMPNDDESCRDVGRVEAGAELHFGDWYGRVRLAVD